MVTTTARWSLRGSKMSVYIAYRDLERYIADNAVMGGIPVNNDIRLTDSDAGSYLLTFDGLDYAVSTKRAQKFVSDVLGQCTGKKRGFFPCVSEYNGRKTAAVVEICEGSDIGYYDMDDAMLLKMLEDLRDESGEPLDERGMINHCYPDPKLPDGDFDLKSVCHQIYYKPVNTSPAVILPLEQDRKASTLVIEDGRVVVSLYDNGVVTEHDIPYELYPAIKEWVRELCEDPVEAYVDDGSLESFVTFGSNGERIFTDPDRTIGFLRKIAGDRQN